jgi:hypothetical protein
MDEFWPERLTVSVEAELLLDTFCTIKRSASIETLTGSENKKLSTPAPESKV